MQTDDGAERNGNKVIDSLAYSTDGLEVELFYMTTKKEASRWMVLLCEREILDI